MALYEELFDQKLKAKEFLADKDQAKVVRERLRRAAEEFDRHNANVFAINMCLHAASSIILSRPESLGETLQTIKKTKGLTEQDATTVLTVSVLYYLVNNKWDPDEAAAAEETYKGQLQKLRSGFDAINWLIGEDAMDVLGLINLSKPAPKIQAAGTPVEQQQQEQKQQMAQQ